MKVLIIAENYRCVGTCDTAFDDEGICVVPELPWRNIADFTLADGLADKMVKSQFYLYAPHDPFIEDEIDGHTVEYLEVDGVYMIYDHDANKHYFFA